MEITKDNIHKYIRNTFELDKSIKCDAEFSVAVSMSPAIQDIELIYSQLIKELNIAVIRGIIKGIKDEYTTVFSSDKDLEMSSFFIIRNNKDIFNKKMILGTAIGSCIQDIYEFRAETYNLDRADIFKIGTFNENDVFVDPYKRFNDNTFILYDNIRYNVEFVSFGDQLDSFNTKTTINAKIGYEFDGVEKWAILCSDGYISKYDILNKMKKEEL